MNRLGRETSPYLLQHADNPVDWFPWGEEAFALARSEDRPVLLSIGYSACHWCHVMAHESFESPTTAALMNERFVNVKVDREERPDVDAVYMDAVVALTGQGGWPMTVFLTPDAEPFFGGTYYPPEPRHSLPSFRQVLLAVSEAWRERRDDVATQSRALVEALARSGLAEPSREPLRPALLDEAVEGLRRSYDAQWGGFGYAPKFPPASAVEFLLRRGVLDLATGTLDGMALGGMYDLLGGGFHRYSVDQRWLVPHFEKMLYDNALLAAAYLHGWVVTGAPRYREVAEETLGYMLRELALDGGGLASAQDADTDGVEGLTFTWTAEEGAPAELLQPFEHGRSILRGELDAETKERLFALREQRPKPFRDDKAIASWNGLALAALAEAGRRLERHDWLDSAVRLAEFLLGPLSTPEGRLHRTWRAGLGEGDGLPRRLRRRRTRVARAPRRDGRAALARGGAAARAPRCRAVRRRRARRLLPHPGRRRAARRAPEELRRQPHTRQGTRCSPTCCCSSPGSTATRSWSAGLSPCSVSSRGPSRECRPRSAGRSAPSTSISRRRASSR